MSTVETIKEKLDIGDVVSRYVKLEKGGSNLKGKCPFHNEKTPSFFVSPSRGTYYCFGCGAKGDIFTFIQEFEKVDFLGALKILADMAGVEIVRESPNARKEKSEKEKLFAILDDTASFFETELSKHPKAMTYLKDRGLKEKTVIDWRLGFAPDAWSELLDHLKTKGYDESSIEKAGLIKRGERGSYYDRFRTRIMFPILDVSSRVIGFTGRIFEGEAQSSSKAAVSEAKYVNSPESTLFHKSEVLYGYDKAKSAIREQNYAILVEGQMDLLMMHQAGLKNTVASSGTALSDLHLKILKRSSENLLLAYDGDGAGLQAALRAWTLALSLGMEVKIAKMPQGEDPASLLVDRPEILKDALKQSKHIINFYLDAILESETDRRKLLRRIEKELLPFVRSLPSSIDQTHFISLIGERTGIQEGALLEELNKIPIEETEENKESIKTPSISDDFITRRLWGMIFWQESHQDPQIGIQDIKAIKDKLAEIMGEEEISRLNDYPLEKKADLVFEAEIYYADNEALKKEVEELLHHLEEEYLKGEFSKAMADLQQAEKGKDAEAVAAILAKCQELSKKLSARKILY